MPSYVLYDRACKLLSTIKAPGDAFGVAYLSDFITFVVDRFHFIHHSPTDAICRNFCNPYDMRNTGMVTAHRRTRVGGPGPNPRHTNGVGVNVQRIINLPNDVNKTVTRRQVRREEPVGSGDWYEYECDDWGNTEVAEQTFNMIRGFKGMCRNMRMSYATFFLRTMVDYINVTKHYKLELAGMSPSGENPTVHRNKARETSALNVMHVSGDVGGVLHGD
jgi:hypothetical protein